MLRNNVTVPRCSRHASRRLATAFCAESLQRVANCTTMPRISPAGSSRENAGDASLRGPHTAGVSMNSGRSVSLRFAREPRAGNARFQRLRQHGLQDEPSPRRPMHRGSQALTNDRGSCTCFPGTGTCTHPQPRHATVSRAVRAREPTRAPAHEHADRVGPRACSPPRLQPQ